MKLSLASLGEEPSSRFVDQTRLAELLGFNAFFHSDEKWTRDPYIRLAAAASATSTLGLGISVTDPYTRHPALTAQASATLAELAPDRLTIVMGAGSHFETLPGYGNPKPTVGLREGIELMRRLWAGERVTLDGEIVKFVAGKLDFDPEATPRVVIASRGPRILALAGEIADGALIGSFATPGGIEYAKRHLAVGLEQAGRTWEGFDLKSWLYVSILDSEDEQPPDNMRRGVSHALWSSRKVLFKMVDELADDITDEFRHFIANAPHEWSPEVMTELRRLIPRGLFDSLAVVGTAEQVVAKLKALEASGVGEAVMWPFPREGEHVEDLMLRLAEQVLPAVQGPIERGYYRLVD
jgi:5,10-methylenetetrahydromethanopterin reductase